MALEILVNTGSGNGLLPDGTKPYSMQFDAMGERDILLILFVINKYALTQWCASKKIRYNYNYS